jgi:hypothetical protein
LRETKVQSCEGFAEALIDVVLKGKEPIDHVAKVDWLIDIQTFSSEHHYALVYIVFRGAISFPFFLLVINRFEVKSSPLPTEKVMFSRKPLLPIKLYLLTVFLREPRHLAVSEGWHLDVEESI